MEVCRFAHDGKPPMLKEVEDVHCVVRALAATVVWLSVIDVLQVMEVAEIGVPLPVESQPVLVEQINDGIAEQMVDCTPHNVATGETDLQREKMEVVATGESDLKG